MGFVAAKRNRTESTDHLPSAAHRVGRHRFATSARNPARSAAGNGATKLCAKVSNQATRLPGNGVGRGIKAFVLTTKPCASSLPRYSSTGGKYHGLNVR